MKKCQFGFYLILQYFEHIEEMEWAIEVCKATGMPVAASMCIGPLGDLHGVSAGECAVRMARAGAHVGKLTYIFQFWFNLGKIGSKCTHFI